MKALQILGKNEYKIIETSNPQCKDHEMLVELQLVSTCPRWDISMMGGKHMFDYSRAPDYPLPPGFPGHETVGVVMEVGSAVKGFKPGDRVAALEHKTDLGAYSTHMVFQPQEVIKLPDTVSDKQAVSMELLKCVMFGMQQFGDIRGKTMVVSGLGPAGILGIQIAKLWGASKVVGIDVNKTRIDYVNSLRLGTAIHADDLKGETFDLGYDCVGAAASVQNLLSMVNRHVVIFGVLRGEVTYPDTLWFKGLTLESYKYHPVTERDRELLLDLVANKGLNTECLQTHEGRFQQYHESIDLLEKQEAIKVFFHPQVDLA